MRGFVYRYSTELINRIGRETPVPLSQMKALTPKKYLVFEGGNFYTADKHEIQWGESFEIENQAHFIATVCTFINMRKDC